MAQVTLRRTRFVVSSKADTAKVKLLPVPGTNIVFVYTDEFVKAYRRGAA